MPRRLTSALLSMIFVPLAVIYGAILVLAIIPVHAYYALKNKPKPKADHPTSWRW